MISKERLEELIEQCATIYSNEYGEIQLKKENELILYENGQNNYILYALEPNKKYHNEIFDEDLFETEEEAKWFAEFDCIERTEKLELPTWEMFDEKKFVWFVDKSQNQCCLYYLNVANKIFINVSGEVIEIGDFTKENYTIACRKAKELFLGEK